MKIRIRIDASVVLYHKLTMQELVIDNTTEKVYDEESREYLDICSKMENVIGFPREEDKKKFDEELAKYIIEESKKTNKEMLDKIVDVFKKVFLNESEHGYVALEGFIINPVDFCAIEIRKFDISVKKE